MLFLSTTSHKRDVEQEKFTELYLFLRAVLSAGTHLVYLVVRQSLRETTEGYLSPPRAQQFSPVMKSRHSHHQSSENQMKK